MKTELYVSLSPKGLSIRRRKEIADWVKELKKSLTGQIEKLEIRIVPEVPYLESKERTVGPGSTRS